MKLEHYQRLAEQTAGAGCESPQMRLMIAALGLCGEAGEFADLIKKMIGHNHPTSDEKLADELGDVLWYVAELATALGFNLEAIAINNIHKLRRRYPDGFSPERSIHRVRE